MLADRFMAVAGSVVLHMILLGFLIFSVWERPVTPVATPSKPIIQARAVDEATAMEPVRRREAEERRKREQAERKRKAAEAEKKRKAEQKRKRIEAEKKRKAELKRKKAEAEKKRKQEVAEKKRLADEKRKKEQAERKRIEEEDRKREEALKKQMAQEAERLAEEAQQQRRQQLSRQQSQYVADIQNKVGRNWLRPPGSAGTLCRVLISQIPSGDVMGVRVTDCDGDIAFQQSVERAVHKASPLPLPADPELFQREIEFVFKP